MDKPTRSEKSNIAPNRIRDFRLAREMSLKQLGDAIGVSFSTVAKFERSQRTLSLDALTAIAKVLEVSPAELIGSPSKAAPPRMIPIIEDFTDGDWLSAIRQPRGHLAIPGAEGNAFAVQPMAASLSAIVEEGSYLVVDPDQQDLLDLKLYALCAPGGGTTFMRYRGEPARLEPVSTDASIQTIPIGREPYRVIGRVIAKVTSL